MRAVYIRKLDATNGLELLHEMEPSSRQILTSDITRTYRYDSGRKRFLGVPTHVTGYITADAVEIRASLNSWSLK